MKEYMSLKLLVLYLKRKRKKTKQNCWKSHLPKRFCHQITLNLFSFYRKHQKIKNLWNRVCLETFLKGQSTVSQRKLYLQQKLLKLISNAIIKQCYCRVPAYTKQKICTLNISAIDSSTRDALESLQCYYIQPPSLTFSWKFYIL